MPFVSKYRPTGEFICALTRRQLFGEGVKRINNIAQFYNYPHTIPLSDESVTTQIPTTHDNTPVVVHTDNRQAFQKLRYDSKISATDKSLLTQLIREHLRGPTISLSVQKKVHAYLLQIFEQDPWFRDNFLGGVPRTDGEVFAKKFLTHTLNLLNLRVTPEGKTYRLPVHACINQTCAAFTPQ